MSSISSIDPVMKVTTHIVTLKNLDHPTYVIGKLALALLMASKGCQPVIAFEGKLLCSAEYGTGKAHSEVQGGASDADRGVSKIRRGCRGDKVV